MKMKTAVLKEKTVILLGSTMACAAACAVPPEISNVVLAQTGARVGTVAYALSADAVVTVEFYTNGVFFADAGSVDFIGDVHRKVTADAGNGNGFAFTTPCDVGDGADLTVELKAWPLDAPPDWMVVDLIAANTVRYYTSSDSIPGGLQDRVYRTDKLVLRKIPAKNTTFTMGLSVKDRDYASTMIAPQEVSFSSDYYIGVWEFTKAQLHNVYPAYPYDPSQTNGLDAAETAETYPAQSLSYGQLRGNLDKTEDASALWPRDGHKVGENSVLAMIRGVCGVELDLPTEAQWEFACHGGFTTGLGDGNEIGYIKNVVTESPTLDAIGWNIKNSGIDATSSFKCHDTGLLKPNGYGLYDMHGNVFELVLDRYVANEVKGTLDPVGPADISITTCVRKGGHCYNDLVWYHAAFRNSQPVNSADGLYGFRVACPGTAR